VTTSPSQPAWVRAIMTTPRLRLVVAAGAIVLLLSTTRQISGAIDLTSSGTVGTTLRLAVPIMLAGFAGLFAERTGIVNIGIEGMMIFGTWCGAVGAWTINPWVGLVFGIIGGILGGLIHAVATVRFNVDHVISGVAINLFAFYSMRYLSEQVFSGHAHGGITQSPAQVYGIQRFNVPILAGGRIGSWHSPDALGALERHHWFVISDVSGLVRGLLAGTSWGTVLALALVPISSYVLWKTRFGLRLRSSGEDPAAAESLGVRIVRLRYIGLMISGGFAGLGGAYLSIISTAYYREGQTGGRGFIGLATTIFGNWRPGGVLGGAMLFGFSNALQLRREDSLTALFLFFTFVAGALLILSMYRRKVVTAAVALGAGALFLVAYLTVDKVPESLSQATPYLVTLIVLTTASQRLRPPAFAGRPYRSGEGH
jgi:simple sugar transport system permease protein